MQLTVRDVSQAIRVPEKQVHHWIQGQGLPASEVNGQYRLNAFKLMEWLTLQQMSIPSVFLAPAFVQALRLDDALKAGGLIKGAGFGEGVTVLKSLVSSLDLPAGYDRDNLVLFLQAREPVATTTLADGIALPHPHFPVIIPGRPATLSLCYFDKPVALQTSNPTRVHTLFMLLAPTPKAHLWLLAKLSHGLKDPQFCRAVSDHQPLETVLRLAGAIEDRLVNEPDSPAISSHGSEKPR